VHTVENLVVWVAEVFAKRVLAFRTKSQYALKANQGIVCKHCYLLPSMLII